MGDRPIKQVFATLERAAAQKSKPPLLGQAVVHYEGAQASVVFNAATKQGKRDQTVIIGTNVALLAPLAIRYFVRKRRGKSRVDV